MSVAFQPPDAPGPQGARTPAAAAIAEVSAIAAAARDRAREALAAKDAEAHDAAMNSLQAALALLERLRAAAEGEEWMKELLSRQPTGKQLAMPNRRPFVIAAAKAAAEKTDWRFVTPINVLGSLVALLGPGRPEVLELEHRILHAVARGALRHGGPPVAACVGRLIRAAQAAIRLDSGEPAEGDEAAAAAARRELAEFLVRARAA